MTAREDDFSSYMRARWPDLVRTLMMLGCSGPEAEDVAQTALTRCYLAWDRVRRADDIDAYVYRTVLNVWSKSRRRRWWSEDPTEFLPDTTTDSLADDVVRRRAMTQALARLSPDHRAVLVLRFGADLSEEQTGAALGLPVGTVKSRTARALARIDVTDLEEAP